MVVDVGGGIGSTTMLLAEAFGGLRFVVQDREGVVGMGVKVCLLFFSFFFVFVLYSCCVVLCVRGGS